MRQLGSIAVVALVLSAAAGSARAVTFSDSLSGGLSPTYWTISQDSPSYTVNTAGGKVTLSQSSPTTGDQACHIVLNLANAVGGNIAGDYTEQVTFSNAFFGANQQRDQVELANLFQDGGVSEDVFDNGGGGGGANYHYWDGNSIYATTTTAATGGTLSLSRTGSTITVSFNGVPFYTANENSPLVYADFRLETQGNPNSDGAQASFTNFSITSGVPEPGSCGALIAGASVLTLRRRARRLGRR
jgi:hypothetical protein